MGNVIRVRAWNFQLNRMWYSNRREHSYYESFDETGNLQIVYVDDKYKSFKLPKMLFTSIKDKNGVEIYDGDIIEGFTPKYLGSERYVGRVFWNEDRWVHGFLEGRPPKAMREDVKVIGNIYENPELLDDNNED